MKKTIIIGGGVIGLSTAYYLVNSGHKVVVLDAKDFQTNCSTGNAGLIVPSHFIPLAAPGVISKGLLWSIRSKSPLSVSLNNGLLPWTIKFLKHSNYKHTERNFLNLYELNKASLNQYKTLSDKLGFALQQQGLSMFFQKKSTEMEELKTMKIAEKLRLEVHYFNKNQLPILEPGLKMNVRGVVHYAGDAAVNPQEYLQSLINYLSDKCVELRPHTELKEFKLKSERVEAIRVLDEWLAADQFIITGGIASAKILSKLGVKLHLQPGKGYSFDNSEPIGLRHPAILVDGRVAVSMPGNITRISGTMEIGGKTAKIRRKKVEGLVETVNSYFPKNTQY